MVKRLENTYFFYDTIVTLFLVRSLIDNVYKVNRLGLVFNRTLTTLICKMRKNHNEF